MVRENLQTSEAGVIDMYATGVCIELVQLVVSIAATHGFAIDQLDGKEAFLHADPPEEEHDWIKMPE